MFQQFFAINCERNLFYFNNDELHENDSCEYSENLKGQCKKLNDCKNEFEKYKTGSNVLKVCKYGKFLMDDLICCPFGPEKLQKVQQKDVIDYNFCIDQFLEFRRSFKNPVDLYDAINSKGRIITEEDCKNIEDHGVNIESDFFYFKPYGELPYEKSEFRDKSKIVRCKNGTKGFELTKGGFLAYGGIQVLKGERTNMAAIGWTQDDDTISYNCGGTILTTRWIITAAHCKFFKNKIADVVRVGDRFLKTIQDDEDAQQLKIQLFIIHPDYKSSLKYNDIAMIHTFNEIKFTKFVTHACIPDTNYNSSYQWGVAGYGQVLINRYFKLKLKKYPLHGIFSLTHRRSLPP